MWMLAGFRLLRCTVAFRLDVRAFVYLSALSDTWEDALNNARKVVHRPGKGMLGHGALIWSVAGVAVKNGFFWESDG